MSSIHASRLGAAIRREIEGMTGVERLVAAELLVGALLIRLLYIRQPIRHDEAYTYLYFASKPLGFALSDYSFPNNHILHTLLVRASTSLLGGSLPAIRLPAFITGLLVVPAVYVTARRFADRSAALLAMAAATVWPALIHYSTDARGYSLIALAFLALILLGEELIEGGGTAICVAIAVVVAIGMYTAPVMLYPAGAALSWIIVEQFRRARSPGVRALLPKIITTVVVAAALTLIAYSPVLVRSGAGVLLRNRYVVALGFGEFVAALPGFAGELRESLGLGISIPLLGAVALLAIAGVVWPRDGRGWRSALALSVLGWCAFLLLATRRPPPGRVWLFLVPLGLAYAGTGLALGVRRLADMRRTDVRAVSAVVALFVAAALAIGIVRGRAVLRTPETGSLADAPEIASYLLARLRPGDRVVVKNPCDHPLDYYLLRRGRRRLQEINAQAGTGRVFVVVEPRHLQTLEAVQQSAPDLPWPELSLAAPVDTFPSARVYTYGFAAPP